MSSPEGKIKEEFDPDEAEYAPPTVNIQQNSAIINEMPRVNTGSTAAKDEAAPRIVGIHVNKTLERYENNITHDHSYFTSDYDFVHRQLIKGITTEIKDFW